MREEWVIVDATNIGQFLMGVNYWPRAKAMYWWERFDLDEVKKDFERIAEYGLGLVRIFLVWEAFQPTPKQVSVENLKRLIAVADLASDTGISLMPTLFCGHMSGVNWLPEWVLDEDCIRQRFPVYTGGRLHFRGLKNVYTDKVISNAQELLCREVARAMEGHRALFACDLGNESSNCFVPPDRETARSWLETMAGTLKANGGGCMVTFGMHAEDLEEDRALGPGEAATVCDFLSMHGYPFYLKWVDDPLDYEVLPFLGAVTEWLGEKPVLFQEFGIPSYPVIPPFLKGDESDRLRGRLWDEETGAIYYRHALERLQQEGMIGAVAWCFGDYVPGLWNHPPLRENPHERFFGLFRYDGSAKLAAEVAREFAGSRKVRAVAMEVRYRRPWLDEEKPEVFYLDPQANLKRLYRKYKDWTRLSAI